MEFKEKDEGTPIMDINDNRVGTVVTIDSGTAYIGFEHDSINILEPMRGYNNLYRKLYPLQDEMIDNINRNKIRLKGDHSAFYNKD